jgi:hypothetical protein
VRLSVQTKREGRREEGGEGGKEGNDNVTNPRRTKTNTILIVSAGYWGGAEWVVREGVGAVGRNEPILVCTYE